MDMSVKIVIIQKTDKMKTTIELVGMIITLPFLALEAMIKGVMYIGRRDFTLVTFTDCGK